MLSGCKSIPVPEQRFLTWQHFALNFCSRKVEKQLLPPRDLGAREQPLLARPFPGANLMYPHTTVLASPCCFTFLILSPNTSNSESSACPRSFVPHRDWQRSSMFHLRAVLQDPGFSSEKINKGPLPSPQRKTLPKTQRESKLN